MILYTYIAPRAGTDNPLGTEFWCQQKFLITLSICCQFKNNLFEVWFLPVFYGFFFTCIYPQAGADNPLGIKFWCQQNSLSLCPFVASLKKISLKSDFLPFFMCVFSHVYSPRQGQTTHWGQTFDVNRKALSLCPFVFMCFFHMYIAPGRGRQPNGDKLLMSTESPYHFNHLLQVSNESLWSLILYIIFHVFIHVYSPGAGADNPLGSEFLYTIKPFVTLVICCKVSSIEWL